MHKVTGIRDPALLFPLPVAADDAGERRQANRAVAVSAAGLALTGLVELAVAVLSGSVALLGDAFHNLSDVSTSLLVFLGFRVSRRTATERYPYGYERAEDLAGIGIAVVIWASAGLAGAQSIHKLAEHGATRHVGWGIAGAAIGILGNQLVAATSSPWAGGSTPVPWSPTPATPGWTPCRLRAPWPGWWACCWAHPGPTRWPGSRSPCSSAMSAGR